MPQFFSQASTFLGEPLIVHIQLAVDNFRIYLWSYLCCYFLQFQEVCSKWIKKMKPTSKGLCFYGISNTGLIWADSWGRQKCLCNKMHYSFPKIFLLICCINIWHLKRKKKVFHCFKSFCLNYFANSTARVVILLPNCLSGLCLWKLE